ADMICRPIAWLRKPAAPPSRPHGPPGLRRTLEETDGLSRSPLEVDERLAQPGGGAPGPGEADFDNRPDPARAGGEAARRSPRKIASSMSWVTTPRSSGSAPRSCTARPA